MLVLWSGGLDSTLVLWRLLNDPKRTEPVRAVTVKHRQIVAHERAGDARRDLIREFRKRDKGAFEHYTVDVSHESSVWRGTGLGQPNLWLGIALPLLEAAEDLYTGWCRGDDLFHHIYDITWFFNHGQRVQGKTGKLVTPLEWTDKVEIITEMQAAGLHDLCWWCEDPSLVTQCDKCHPCERHFGALAVVRLREERVKAKVKAPDEAAAAKADDSAQVKPPTAHESRVEATA